ncbi:hypothetical protein FGO68_gene15544 [Halteria grandinella]|uniref:Uncharacterized protein n=1 Tax=Halteria grandinella TaxID=5974 RepID=A0A8J8T627_HALGN|nr:hypothetical protein FGO68_gene15544 [Halteria grandinella]
MFEKESIAIFLVQFEARNEGEKSFKDLWFLKDFQVTQVSALPILCKQQLERIKQPFRDTFLYVQWKDFVPLGQQHLQNGCHLLKFCYHACLILIKFEVSQLNEAIILLAANHYVLRYNSSMSESFLMHFRNCKKQLRKPSQGLLFRDQLQQFSRQSSHLFNLNQSATFSVALESIMGNVDKYLQMNGFSDFSKNTLFSLNVCLSM